MQEEFDLNLVLELPLDLQKNIYSYVGEKEYIENIIDDWKDCITKWNGYGDEYKQYKNLKLLCLFIDKKHSIKDINNLPSNLEKLNLLISYCDNDDRPYILGEKLKKMFKIQEVNIVYVYKITDEMIEVPFPTYSNNFRLNN